MFYMLYFTLSAHTVPKLISSMFRRKSKSGATVSSYSENPDFSTIGGQLVLKRALSCAVILEQSMGLGTE